MKKSIGIWLIIFVFILFFSSYKMAFAQTDPPTPNPTDYKFDISGPTITPPDYSKNECPICGAGQFWSSDHGCCKFDINFSSASSFNIVCEQPSIEVCTYDKFCISGKGCLLGGTKLSTFNPSELCNKLIVPEENSQCLTCMQDNEHVWTAIGCIPIGLANLISSYLVKLVMSIGGAAGFLVFLYGSYLILTSGDDVERVKLGRKYITSSLKGIILIIFGFLIFRIITVDILKIPGFE